MRHNLNEQLAWLGSCSSWHDAFGTRFDATLENKVALADSLPNLTVSSDWEPLWQRAHSGGLCGGDVSTARSGQRHTPARQSSHPPVQGQSSHLPVQGQDIEDLGRVAGGVFAQSGPTLRRRPPVQVATGMSPSMHPNLPAGQPGNAFGAPRPVFGQATGQSNIDQASFNPPGNHMSQHSSASSSFSGAPVFGQATGQSNRDQTSFNPPGNHMSQHSSASSSFSARSQVTSSAPMSAPATNPMDFSLSQFAYVPGHEISSAQAQATPISPFALVGELKNWRLSVAARGNKKPFMILSDKVLDAIAQALPTTDGQLLSVNGIGQSKLEAYGDEILRMCRSHAARGGLAQTSGLQQVHPNPQASVSQAAQATTWMEKPAARKAKSAPPAKRRKGPTAPDDDCLVELSSQQRAVLECISQGTSVFFTGSAGTGKSLLLRRAIQALRNRYPEPDEVAVCASTGIAAVNIGGVTLHSWAGVGVGEESPSVLLDRVKASEPKIRKWVRAKALIIDELSMLDGRLLDALEYIARNLKTNDTIFGALQLVLCGDFFQLPPVELGRGAIFCFQALCWEHLVPKHARFILSNVFRQRDPALVQILEEVRMGRLSPESCAALYKTASNTFPGSTVEPTRLFPLNSSADRLNQRNLAALPGQEMRFTAQDKGTGTYLTNLQRDCRAPTELVLKAGAQVMLLKNINVQAGLVNGARGIVKSFEQDKNGDMLPVVEMSVADNTARASGFRVTIKKEQWNIEQTGKVVASRQQIPLMLAWAISIHKSQGMTIDMLEADLAQVFEAGQAYVALSRATSLDRMRVLNFRPQVVKTHPAVAEFGRQLAACCMPDAGMGSFQLDAAMASGPCMDHHNARLGLAH